MKKLLIVFSSSFLLLNATTQAMFKNSRVVRLLTNNSLRTYHEKQHANRVIAAAHNYNVADNQNPHTRYTGPVDATKLLAIGYGLTYSSIKNHENLPQYEELVLSNQNNTSFIEYAAYFARNRDFKTLQGLLDRKLAEQELAKK